MVIATIRSHLIIIITFASGAFASTIIYSNQAFAYIIVAFTFDLSASSMALLKFRQAVPQVYQKLLIIVLIAFVITIIIGVFITIRALTTMINIAVIIILTRVMQFQDDPLVSLFFL